MILPLMDDEPILDEIAERNIRENERMRMLLRLKKCNSMQEVEELIMELEKSIGLSSINSLPRKEELELDTIIDNIRNVENNLWGVSVQGVSDMYSVHLIYDSNEKEKYKIIAGVQFVDDNIILSDMVLGYDFLEETKIFDVSDAELEIIEDKITEIISNNKRYKYMRHGLAMYNSKRVISYMVELTESGVITWNNEKKGDKELYFAEYGDVLFEIIFSDIDEKVFNNHLCIKESNYLQLDFYNLIDSGTEDLIRKKPKIITVEDCIVRSNNFACINKEHNMKRVKALVSVQSDTDIYEVDVEASYCTKCDKYFILENEYKRLKVRGRICCRVIEYETYVKMAKNKFNLNQESFLYEYGYNTNSQKNLSDTERQRILSFIIENDIASAEKVTQFLVWLIEKNRRRTNMNNAIMKWEKDITFVREYQKIDKTIRVRNIFRKKGMKKMDFIEDLFDYNNDGELDRGEKAALYEYIEELEQGETGEEYFDDDIDDLSDD